MGKGSHFKKSGEGVKVSNGPFRRYLLLKVEIKVRAKYIAGIRLGIPGNKRQGAYPQGSLQRKVISEFACHERMAESLHRAATKQVDASCSSQLPCAGSGKNEPNVLALINQLVDNVKDGRSALNFVHHEVRGSWMCVDYLNHALWACGQGASFICAEQVYAVRMRESFGYPRGLASSPWTEKEKTASRVSNEPFFVFHYGKS